MKNKSDRPFFEVCRSFKNILQLFAKSNTNFVIIIFVIIASIIYKTANSDIKILWILACINGLLCLISFVKSKNLTETTLTLLIGLFTIFTVEWSNEFIFIFIVTFLVFVILSFMMSSIQLAARIEAIISIASYNYQSLEPPKVKYDRLYNICKKPTQFHQIDIEQRAIIVKELVFVQYPLDKIEIAKLLIESFVRLYGFTLDKSIKCFILLDNIFIVQKKRNFIIKDMNQLIECIQSSAISPEDFIQVIINLRKHLIYQTLNYDGLISNIILLSLSIRDEEVITESILI